MLHFLALLHLHVNSSARCLCYSGYQPANKPNKPMSVTELQPPDLWINYERGRTGNLYKSDEPDEETAMMTQSTDCRDDVDSGKIYILLLFFRFRSGFHPLTFIVSK